jgi:hypothetical protein
MGVKELRFLRSVAVCNETIIEQLTIANIVDFEKYRRLWEGQRIIDYQRTIQYSTVQYRCQERRYVGRPE